MSTANKNFKVKNGLDAVGDITTGGALYVNGASGAEGGQLELAKAPSGSTNGATVVVDVYDNRLRFFEKGSPNRGAYIDLTAAGASVGTNLLGGVTGAMNYAQEQATKQTGISASGVTIVSKSFTTNGYPVQVLVTGDAENNTAGGWVKLQLYRDGTAIGKIVHVEMSAGSENVPYALTVIDTPSAGTYTYALKTASSVSSGIMNFGETDGPVLTLVELSGPKGDAGAGGTSETFKTISTPSGTSPVADSSTDTLSLVAGSNITITGDASADSITFAATDTNTTYSVSAETTTGGANLRLTGSDAATDDVKIEGSGATTVTRTDANTITVSSTDTDTVTNAFTNIEVSGQDTVSAESTSDTLTLVAGENVTITTNATSDSITISSTGGGGGGASVTVSDTAPETPTEGDLWYSSAVGKTYIYYDDFWVEANPAQIGPEGKFRVSATAPTSPLEGQVWYNSDAGRFYVYYDNFWVEASSNEAGPQGRYFVGEVPQENPVEGDTWFNSTNGRFYIYYNEYWVENSSNLTGPSGVVNVLSPITNTGTQEEAIIGINQSLLSIAQSQVVSLVSDLSGKQATISGAATTITSSDLTVSRALVSNGTGKVAVSTVTSAELGHLSGVTSGVQTQLGTLDTNKANLSGASFTGNISTTGTVAGLASEPSANTNTAQSVGYVGMPQFTGTNANTGALTLSKAHAGEHIYTTTSRTVTIPANGSVPFEIGTTIVFVSGAGATTTIAITSDTLILAGSGAGAGVPGTSRTLAAHGMATAVKVAATTWYISGNGLT